MKARTIALMVIAVAAGLAAAYLVTSLGPPKTRGAGGGDYYCYELRQAWACAYAKAECEARLARETPTDVKKGCTPYWNDSLSP